MDVNFMQSSNSKCSILLVLSLYYNPPHHRDVDLSSITYSNTSIIFITHRPLAIRKRTHTRPISIHPHPQITIPPNDRT